MGVSVARRSRRQDNQSRSTRDNTRVEHLETTVEDQRAQEPCVRGTCAVEELMRILFSHLARQQSSGPFSLFPSRFMLQHLSVSNCSRCCTSLLRGSGCRQCLVGDILCLSSFAVSATAKLCRHILVLGLLSTLGKGPRRGGWGGFPPARGWGLTTQPGCPGWGWRAFTTYFM